MNVKKAVATVCLSLLVGPKNNAESVAHPGDPDACELCALRTAMARSPEPTAYYTTVKDPESRKVRLIRMEGVPGESVNQSYVDSAPARARKEQDRLLQVKGPGSTNVLAEIRTRLTQLKASDAGKLVLFEDRSGLGISPESLGLSASPMPVALREAMEKAKASSDATQSK